MSVSHKIAIGSLGVSLIVLVIKGAAYALTGSVALYSDALESVINVATAIAAFLAIRYAAKPADKKHPYGHQKAEYLSAAIIGVMIIIAGISILLEACSGFLSPKPIDAPVLGLAVSSIATVMNAIWSAVLIRQGRRRHSPSLAADGKHLLADVATSSGVVIGVGLVVVSGVEVLDAGVAALVALHVLSSGWAVIRESWGGLLDEAVSDDNLQRIRDIISANAGGAIEAHDLRTRYASKATFIDFHLVTPCRMTVKRAHEICDRLEAALMEALDEAVVNIHVEPESMAEYDVSSEAKRPGGSVPAAALRVSRRNGRGRCRAGGDGELISMGRRRSDPHLCANPTQSAVHDHEISAM
ncbi:cation diffusion facilitator family transporter [uncultured Rhodoblastus sp.]|uniref:cation diffusion facilitator family transporter n=1 Tax=uncultured Rhodoblastus sp. TaxID=543037 RepID=UPI0031455103